MLKKEDLKQIHDKGISEEQNTSEEVHQFTTILKEILGG